MKNQNVTGFRVVLLLDLFVFFGILSYQVSADQDPFLAADLSAYFKTDMDIQQCTNHCCNSFYRGVFEERSILLSKVALLSSVVDFFDINRDRRVFRTSQCRAISSFDERGKAIMHQPLLLPFLTPYQVLLCPVLPPK